MIEIPKENEDSTNCPCWIETRDMNNRMQRPLFKCKCGDILILDDFHIHYDGLVTGAFYHLNSKQCEFKALLKLAGWPHGLDFPREY